ncbi:MAG: DNA primase [Methylococcaceae bacterium]|nr:DNA primase [Methylococcaceae bacterium]
MSGRIPREFIDDLLVRVDIVDLIDSHVPLKKAGSSYVARCPFHTEKSPSFSVNRKKQFYHCFGCGVGGNAISFLIEFSHLEFVEAIEDLAGFVGIDVPREKDFGLSVQKQDYSALYSILEQVAVFYVEQLRNSPEGKGAIKYLKHRGLSGEIAKEFSLGYAPDRWDALASRFDNSLLLKAGMLTSKENGKSFDRFRGRLVFPIRDKRKRIVGFGGRVLDDSLPKYLNSPETPIFSKGKELYGLFELLEKDSRPKRILLVEGYMDVLALSQFGINYSVAVLGTAPSKTHMDLLFRFTSEIVFCFDGDIAGKKAAWRAVQETFSCLRDGRLARVMLLPQAQDPDSLIRELGVDEFERQILNSQTLSGYFFEYISKEIDLSTIEGRACLISEAKPHIEKIPGGVFREMMLEELDGLSPGTNLKKLDVPPVTLTSDSLPSTMHNREKIVMALLLQNPEMVELIEKTNPDWEKMSFRTKDALLDVMGVIEKNQLKNTGRLLEVYRDSPERHQWLSEIAMLEALPLENNEFDAQQAFEGALIELFKQGKKQYFNDMMEEKVKRVVSKER